MNALYGFAAYLAVAAAIGVLTGAALRRSRHRSERAHLHRPNVEG